MSISVDSVLCRCCVYNHDSCWLLMTCVDCMWLCWCVTLRCRHWLCRTPNYQLTTVCHRLTIHQYTRYCSKLMLNRLLHLLVSLLSVFYVFLLKLNAVTIYQFNDCTDRIITVCTMLLSVPSGEVCTLYAHFIWYVFSLWLFELV